MDDRVDVVSGKNLLQSRPVSDVHLVEGESFSGDLGDAMHCLQLCVGEIVRHHNVITLSLIHIWATSHQGRLFLRMGVDLSPFG